ncbi:MAG: hypothetical protein M1831_004174 [Alyxoria varia]|nr:MAG: hypothetical protein M1831_004174 [Alyxoria varia]
MPETDNASTPSNDLPTTADATTVSSVSEPPAAMAWTALSDENKLWMKRYRTEISASTASLCSTFSAYPLDSMKTRMQAYKFSSFLDCVRKTYYSEGYNGFWRGALAPMMSITLVRTISFSMYQKSKYTYDKWIHAATGVSPLEHANTPNAWPNLYTAACFGSAGATSGALITAISCPFELTKVSSQITVLMERGVGQTNSFDADVGRENRKKSAISPSPPKNIGTIRTAQMIMKHRGAFGLYSGFHLHLLRDTIGTTIYFITYESSKQMLANARGNSPTSPLAVMMAGGFCGLASWAFIFPIDTAKSIYQRNILHKTFPAAAAALPPEESPFPAETEQEAKAKFSEGKSRSGKVYRPPIQFFNRRMYRGIGVSMSRSCVINAIFFSVFEGMKKYINGLDVEDSDAAAAATASATE